ncbi:hypothetical protein ACFL1X_03395 [Candidatus Hydrogenedentota bacterium]
MELPNELEQTKAAFILKDFERQDELRMQVVEEHLARDIALALFMAFLLTYLMSRVYVGPLLPIVPSLTLIVLLQSFTIKRLRRRFNALVKLLEIQTTYPKRETIWNEEPDKN